MQIKSLVNVVFTYIIIKLKRYFQGADSTITDKITYFGDSSVVIDKNCVNIQIHKILPRKDKTSVMSEKEQYMFAIYIPKENSIL